MQNVAGARHCHEKKQYSNAPLSRPSSTPIEQSEHIREVPLACSLDPEQLGDWNIEELNNLPNIRSYRPTPRRYHTPRQIIAEEVLNVLPSLGDLRVDISYRARKSDRMTAGTEVWQKTIA